MLLHPGGAPGGAGERLLLVKKTVGLAEGLPGSQPLLCSATPPTLCNSGNRTGVGGVNRGPMGKPARLEAGAYRGPISFSS